MQGVLHRFKEGEEPVLVSDKSIDEKGVRDNDVWQIPFIAPSAKEGNYIVNLQRGKKWNNQGRIHHKTAFSGKAGSIAEDVVIPAPMEEEAFILTAFPERQLRISKPF
jgi:hypothetical protein